LPRSRIVSRAVRQAEAARLADPPWTVGADERTEKLTKLTTSPNRGPSLRSDVRIRIYDVQGRVVRTLADSHRAAGYYSEVWDLTNAAGQRVAPGVYFCRMEAGSFRDTKKVVLLQ